MLKDLFKYAKRYIKLHKRYLFEDKKATARELCVAKRKLRLLTRYAFHYAKTAGKIDMMSKNISTAHIILYLKSMQMLN